MCLIDALTEYLNFCRHVATELPKTCISAEVAGMKLAEGTHSCRHVR
jgi:hypothetical protein